MFRPLLPTQLATDVVLAVLLCALLLVGGVANAGGLVGVVVTVGLAGALALRRSSPALALAVAWLFAVVQMGTLQDPGVQDLLIAPVLHATSAYGSRRVRVAGLVSAIVGAVTAGAYETVRQYAERSAFIQTPADAFDYAGKQGIGVLVFVAALLLLPWLAGLVVRSRSAARMSREAQLLAERDAARADRAVAVEQERVRIAREMHDIVAHSLAVVIAQADGARYALRSDAGAADRALTTISTTARGALGDVRELLGALRHEQGAAPTPDVDDVDRLVEQLRDVGLDVRLERDGDPATLPRTTQLAVYRVVQESLTNAYKHGERGAPVHARLAYGTDTVAIDVVNRRAADGRPGPGTGHGLVGMRERASMSGGSMTAGPRGADFAVAVRMPTHPASGSMPLGRIASAPGTSSTQQQEQESTAP